MSRAKTRSALAVILFGFLIPGALAADASWVLRPTQFPGPLTGVAYGVDRYVAVGCLVHVGSFQNIADRGIILASPNGTEWWPQPVAGDPMLAAVTFGHGTFIAVGKNGVILNSTNAMDWIQAVP